MLASIEPQQFDEWMLMYGLWAEQQDTPQDDKPTLGDSLNSMRQLAGV